MSLEAPSLSLSWLNYDPKDYNDIFPYAEAFEEIRKKIGQNFWLRKIGKGNRANIFEIYKNNHEGIYVVKLPRLESFELWETKIRNKVKEEILLHNRFILEYEFLVKKLHKEYLQIISQPYSSTLFETLDKTDKIKDRKSENLSIISHQQEVLQTIKIPRLLDIYQGEVPIIIMEKLQGSTLRFEIINYIFEPLFSSLQSFWPHGELIPSDKTLYENCKNQNINDKDVALLLKKLDKHYNKKESEKYINWMLNTATNTISFEGLIDAMEKMFDADNTIFTLLFRGTPKSKKLQEAYNFFLQYLPEHPDPNLHNFIITPEGELWIIDFW